MGFVSSFSLSAIVFANQINFNKLNMSILSTLFVVVCSIQLIFGQRYVPAPGYERRYGAKDVVRVEDVSAKRKIGRMFLIAQPNVAVGPLLHRERAKFFVFEYIAHSILRHFINCYFYI